MKALGGESQKCGRNGVLKLCALAGSIAELGVKKDPFGSAEGLWSMCFRRASAGISSEFWSPFSVPSTLTANGDLESTMGSVVLTPETRSPKPHKFARKKELETS